MGLSRFLCCCGGSDPSQEDEEKKIQKIRLSRANAISSSDAPSRGGGRSAKQRSIAEAAQAQTDNRWVRQRNARANTYARALARAQNGNDNPWK